MELQASTQKTVKIDNQKIILQILINKGPMSRADLAKEMGSSKPTVSKNVEDLLKSNKVIEIGKDTNMYGKKGILLDINQDYAHILALDLSKNLLRIAVSNLRHELIHYHKISYDMFVEGDETDVTKHIDTFFEKEQIDTIKIKQVVIAFPGVVGHNNDFYLTNIKSKEMVLKQIKPYIQQRLAVPLLIKNDVNLAVVAEKTYGKYSDEANLYLMSCDIGVGVGIIINHKLYEGNRNAAGEVGFILPSSKDGKYTILEDKISLQVLLNRYEARTQEKLTYEQFVLRIQQKDQMSLAIYESVVEDICVAITNITTVLDIQHVVVTGRVFELHMDMIPYINRRISQMTPFETIVTPTELVKMSLKGAVIVGTEAVINQMV